MNSYWAAQEGQRQPACLIAPRRAEQVQTAVGVLSDLNAHNRTTCPFAIRAGGHGMWGFSNQRGGITIDLRAMHSITVSKDKKIASIEPGARWTDVALKLDALGVAVPGGRVGSVGVGGLSLAGESVNGSFEHAD